MRNSSLLRAAALCATVFLVCGCADTIKQAQSVIDSGGASAQTQRAKKQAVLPHCSGKPTKTVAIYEPEKNWWQPLGLPSPDAVIKVYVMQSGCFVLLDRSKGFDVAQQERSLASGGQLRQGSNVGKGQVRAADYVLVPDLVSKNADASGSNLTAIAGALMGQTVIGAIVSNIHITGKTADVVLTLTNVRSSQQVAMAEGHGEHTDWGFGGGAAIVGGSGLGGAGINSYQNTDVGQVVMLAYLDAYAKMVKDLGYQTTDVSDTSVQQAVTMAKPGHLYKTAGGKGIVRPLTAGMMLYPTGAKNGVWWEVKDELGNQGWVSSLLIALAK